MTNLSAVRALVQDAKPVPAVAKIHDPDPSLPREHGEAGNWVPDELGLPRDCPVVPLGISGKVCWFVDGVGQVQSLEPPYGKGHILGLFLGRHNYLAWAWPRYGKKGIDGFAADHAAAALLKACAAKGPWSDVDIIRGRGAWRGRDGELIIHAGTDLLLGKNRARHAPGEIDGFVYPTLPELPLPWPEPVTRETNPGRLLLDLLNCWNWERPLVDPRLLLGWIAAAMIGGALKWRPAVFVTGDKATGKSTLQHLLKGLLGKSLVHSDNTTGAGIYQHIGHDSLPVAIDELEATSDPRKAIAVLELARIAGSGGLMLRGGDKHNPVKFRARSCFLFSSINAPPLQSQDLSRMALLRLKKLDKDAEEPDLDERYLAVVGRCILRRLMDEWGRYEETLSAYRAELGRAGMDGRGRDTFGTLLACCDMVEHEGWSEERLNMVGDGDLIPISELMAVAGMHEFEDAGENWRKCLSHLLSVRVEAWRSGNRATVGQVLYDLWHEKDMNVTMARKDLGQTGLGLVHRGQSRDWWLAVPNANPLTRELFAGSHWAGVVGAGVWSGALRQSPRPGVHDVHKARIGGDVQACTLISLRALYGEGGIMTEDQGDDD